MKTTFVIEIDTPDKEKLTILPDEGKSEEDFTKEELEECRKDFADDLHNGIVNFLTRYIEDSFEEESLDNLEECYIEGWEYFDDYGIKISLKKYENEKEKNC